MRLSGNTPSLKSSRCGPQPPSPWPFLDGSLLPCSGPTRRGDTAFIKALLCITAGFIWQFVLTLILTRREQGTLRWSRVRDALWLLSPRDPRSGRGRWQSVWMSIIVHSAQSVFVIFVILSLALG
jgi:hypothetical protein